MKRNILLTALLFTFISCSNLVQRNEIASQQNQKSPDGKTYIVISSSSLSRAAENVINEDTNFGPDQGDSSKLTALVLTGKKTSAEGEAETLLTAETYAELINQQIMIEPGEWTFTLAGKLNNYLFSGTEAREIIQGEINTLSFTLKSDEQYGSLELTIEWSNTSAKVMGYLYDPDDISKMIASKTASEAAFEEFEEPDETGATLTKHRTTLTFDKTSAGNKLPSGTYYLKVNFDGPESTLNLGSAAYYVTITNGLITKKTITTDLSPTYKLEWNRDGGEFASGQLIAAGYSRKSLVTLPEISKPGYFFDGWFDNEEFNGNALTQFSCTTYTGDVTLYAKWRAPVLYVSGTGDDTTGNGTEAKPFKTIDKACEEIIATGDENMNWAIKIIGEVKGVPKGSSGTDATYGPNTIPADVTQDYAKSILLTGVTPIETEFAEPQDSLNRNQSSNVNGVSYGTVLTIETSVPVTITNLKITGGVGSSEKGAGIHICNGATVMLGDGVLLIHNRAGSNSHGGAIQNEGTLFIYGTAVIGDKTIEAYAYDSSTDYDFETTSNRGGMGGGIYNGKPGDSTVTAKLYLGYKGFDSDGITPLKEEFKGGFYHNGGSGGALYNSANCHVYFDSGIFAWNGTCASGGAIYNATGGTIEMTGGSILNNRSYEGGNYTSYGGGVSNASVFIMSGGTINKNISANDTGYGGGVYNTGTFYMYGTAVIGDKSATTCATAESWGNKARRGGGIFNTANGNLYIGYLPDSDGNPVKETLQDGISYNGFYYNYSFCPLSLSDSSERYGGGAIESIGNLKIASGTFAYNTTEGYGGAIWQRAGRNDSVFEISGGTIKNNIAKGEGGAIYISQKNAGNDNVLYLGGTYSPSIPSEIKDDDGELIPEYVDYKNDIYIQGTKTCITLTSSLPTDFETLLTFASYNTDSSYLVAAEGVNLESEYAKFKVTDQNLNGRTKMWKTTTAGKLEPVVTPYYVSEDGNASNDGLTKDTAFAAVSSALAKIWAAYQADNTNGNQDYIIYISGSVKGLVNIEDMASVKYANSITLQGLNGKDTTTNLPKDTLDGNYSEGTAGNTVSVSSIIPIAIKSLNITGSKMTGNTSLNAGVYVNPGSTVSIEDGTVISGNNRGIYAAQATLIIDGATIQNNTGKGNGAGLSSQSSNVKMISGSITGNSFDTDFLSTNSISEISGGGIYLSDDSTFEMTGGTISANATDISNSTINVLGKGIYVSENASFNIGNTALVYWDNDVYLKNNVNVNVISELKDGSSRRGSSNPAAMLTPATYPTTDGEGNIEEIELLNLVDNSLNMFNVDDQFRVTPEKLGDGQLQYWKIESLSGLSSEKHSKLVKVSGTTVSVSFTTGVAQDIQVRVTNGNGGTVEKDISYTGTGTIIFTADPDYSSYKWKFDGTIQTTTTPNVLEVDTSDLDPGVYDITLEAKDSSGNRCSYSAQIRVYGN